MPDVICGMLCVQEEERFWDEVVRAGVLLTPGEVPCSFSAWESTSYCMQGLTLLINKR